MPNLTKCCYVTPNKFAMLSNIMYIIYLDLPFSPCNSSVVVVLSSAKTFMGISHPPPSHS